MNIQTFVKIILFAHQARSRHSICSTKVMVPWPPSESSSSSRWLYVSKSATITVVSESNST